MRKNMLKYAMFGVMFYGSQHTTMAQGFINLNFESARIIPVAGSPIYPYEIAITNALPGWSVFGSTSGSITYNNPSLGSTWVTLMATNGYQISGSYSVILQGGLSPFPAFISQTGQVPTWATTLLFAAQPGSGTLQVSLGGQILPFYNLGSGINYTSYGVDISAFAGQTGELMFSAVNVPSGMNSWNLDNIQFSSSPVPEPSTLALAALGVSLLGLRRWLGVRKLQLSYTR